MDDNLHGLKHENEKRQNLGAWIHIFDNTKGKKLPATCYVHSNLVIFEINISINAWK